MVLTHKSSKNWCTRAREMNQTHVRDTISRQLFVYQTVTMVSEIFW